MYDINQYSWRVINVFKTCFVFLPNYILLLLLNQEDLSCLLLTTNKFYHKLFQLKFGKIYKIKLKQKLSLYRESRRALG